ncbi:MAG: PD40 domain-containing protein [Anaerolineales bacterium]|nr:PD40 domain-containing protein [Anaerolineales bacterium]
MKRPTVLLLVLVVATVIMIGIWLFRERSIQTGEIVQPETGEYILYLRYPVGESGNLFALNVNSGKSIQLTQGNRTNWAFCSIGCQQVAFDNRDGSKGTLYVMSLEDGELTKIVEQTVPYFYGFSWSPDNEWLAWGSAGENQNGIFISRINERQPIYLADGSQPNWSLDGKQILYTKDFDIYVIEIESGSTSRLFEREGSETYPQWSPDGNHIAFVQNITDPVWGGVARQELYIADAKGNNERFISDIGKFTLVHWSKDGNYLLFDIGGIMCKYSIPNEERDCSKFPAEDAIWSPDGEQIAYGNYGKLCIISSTANLDYTSARKCFETQPKERVQPVGWKP